MEIRRRGIEQEAGADGDLPTLVGQAGGGDGQRVAVAVYIVSQHLQGIADAVFIHGEDICRRLRAIGLRLEGDGHQGGRETALPV